MKNHTNLPQSKVLATFLPIESADMKWFVPADNEGEFVEDVSLIKYKSEYNLFEKVTDWDDTPYIPCWSLDALLKLIPNFNMFKRTIECRIETTNHLVVKACEPIDACYEMIVKLYEKNLL